MPSPFPGMDPYLEEPDIWPDVHLMFLASIRAELSPRLPKEYVARVDRYVWLEEPDGDSFTRAGKPDVFVTGPGTKPMTGTAVALMAPVTAVLPAVRHEGNRYLRVIDVKSRRVVTVIELLSPSNKELGKDHDHYLAKREEFLGSRTNLVEIDLLRADPRLPMGEPGTVGCPLLRRRLPGHRFSPSGHLALQRPRSPANHPDPARSLPSARP